MQSRTKLVGLFLLTACSGNTSETTLTHDRASGRDADADTATIDEPSEDAAQPPELDADTLDAAMLESDAAASDAGSADAGAEAALDAAAVDSGADAGLDAAAPDAASMDASGEFDADASGEFDASDATSADAELSDADAADAADATLPEAAAPLRIDFEAVTGMANVVQAVPVAAQLSDFYLASTGAVFSSAEVNFVAAVNLGQGHATSGTKGIGAANANGVLSYGTPLHVRFFVPGDASRKATTRFVRLRGDHNPATGSATLIAYDASETELGRVSASDTTQGLTLELSQPNIHHIVVTETMPNIAFDDLEFMAVVPLP